MDCFFKQKKRILFITYWVTWNLELIPETQGTRQVERVLVYRKAQSQFRDTINLIIHVFGLELEIGVPRGDPTGTGRVLHNITDAGLEPSNLEV